MAHITLPRLHVGDAWRAGALTLFPLWSEAPSIHGLDLNASTIDVGEREGAPVVSELVVRNRGTRTALLLEGEMLEGGWQHRVLNSDLLLEPGQAHVADVWCVEHGRWHGTGAHTRTTRMSSGSVRAALRRDHTERQETVWHRVAEFDIALGASPTASLADHLDRVAQSTAHNDDQHSFAAIPRRPLSGQRGVLIALGGEPAWLELMPSSGALARRWRSLIDGALLDAALAPSRDTRSQSARDFVAAAMNLRLTDTGGAGAGRAVAGVRRGLNARGLTHTNGTLLHSLMFNSEHRSLALV